ncbi:MAG: Uma2 family endonuclease [Myxococcota bacterium]
MSSGSWDVVTVPRALEKFPMAFEPGRGFSPSKPERWPRLPGRLEFYEERLHVTPPCGEQQAAIAANIVFLLAGWARAHAGFEVGANEAGMLLGGAVRAADAAVWRASSRRRSSGFHRRPPLLAVEVSGEDENEDMLMDKARWYLEQGVETVWLVLPEERQVVVVTAKGRKRVSAGRLPAPAGMKDFQPALADVFR